MDQAELFNLLVDFFKQYGYWLLFAACLLENVAFIGLIIPGEFFIIGTAFFAARGDFNVFYVFVLALTGSLLGNSIGYFFGLKTGRSFIEKLGLRFPFVKRRILAAERYFDKYGATTVFFGRFASGVKAFITALAGSAKMDYSTFLVYSSASALIWNATMTVLGYFSGANWRLILKLINRVGLGVLTVMILLIVAPYLVSKLRKKHE